MKRFRSLPEKKWLALANEIKMMLHASRDCMRNRFKSNLDTYDPKKVSFNNNDPYFGEAFGIVRGLKVLNHGYFGADSPVANERTRTNLKWWFRQLEQEVLKEENFEGNHQCDVCLNRYGRDETRHKNYTGEIVNRA